MADHEAGHREGAQGDSGTLSASMVQSRQDG